jgi:hypothetical protein
MCGKFGLLKHIDGTAPPRPTDPSRPSWEPADFCIRRWLYGFVSDAVLNFTMGGKDQTARDLQPLPVQQGAASDLPKSRLPHHDSG